MSIEEKVDYAMRALDKAIYREIPVATCSVKESKNQWMRDKIKAIIGNKLKCLADVGPAELKHGLR